MPSMTALDINVYDAALERVRFVYDNCDDVIVSMSGGKDSTVVLHLAEVVATERGQLPINTDADPETIKLDRLADNRIHEFSSWDNEMLGSELAGLNLGFDFDLGTLDFSMDLDAFDVAGPGNAESEDGINGADPATNGGDPATGANGEPFISASDIARTVNRTKRDYIEAVCNHCGGTVFVEKPK